MAEAEARETTSPHRLTVLAGLLKRDRIEPEQADGTPYHCSHCMACTDVCLHDNDVSLLMSLARARLLAGHAAPEQIRHISGQFAVAGNAAGRSLEAPLMAAASAHGQTVVAFADEVYWPGCEVLSKDPDAAQDALRAATLSGTDVPAVTPASASCCGLPLFWAGELDGFRSHATRFAAQFRGVKKVIAHDPTCAHAVKVRYPKLGIRFEPEVQTLVQRLSAPWPATSRTDHSDDPAPAYLDGCASARGLKETASPRRLIEKATGRSPPKFDGTDRQTDCCGGQGLLPELVPATARAMAQARIDAFRATGATRLLTGSPRCRTHLRSVDPSLPIDDLVAWLAGR